MNKLIAILLLSTVACFGGSKFVSGKFVNGAMPFPYIPAPSNGLLTQLKGYWTIDSYSINSSPASVGGINLVNNGGGGAFIGSALINGGCDVPTSGDSGIGFYTSGTTPLYLTNDYSISIWVSPYDPSGQAGVYGTVFRMANNDGVPEAVTIGLNSDTEEVSYGICNNVDGTQLNQTSLSWSANSWIHFVLVYNSTDSLLSLYINGIGQGSFYVSQVASSTAVAEIDVLTDFAITPLEWGSYAGKADEVGVWQSQLTPAQITQLYNSGAGFPFSSFNY